MESTDKLSSLTIDQQNKLRAISKLARKEIIQNVSDNAITQVLNKYEPMTKALNLPKFRARLWLQFCISIIDKEIKRG